MNPMLRDLLYAIGVAAALAIQASDGSRQGYP